MNKELIPGKMYFLKENPEYFWVSSNNVLWASARYFTTPICNVSIILFLREHSLRKDQSLFYFLSGAKTIFFRRKNLSYFHNDWVVAQ